MKQHFEGKNTAPYKIKVITLYHKIKDICFHFESLKKLPNLVPLQTCKLMVNSWPIPEKERKEKAIIYS